MRVLVTGAAGFIGSHVVEMLVRAGHSVVGIDNFDPFYPRALKEANIAAVERAVGPFELVEADVRDRSVQPRLVAGGPVEAVVHLAGQTDARQSIQFPADHLSVNIDGTLAMLELARDQGTSTFLFASSCVVYGDRAPVPYDEADPAIQPTFPYALSKRSGEMLCYTFHRLYGMHTTSLRFFSVYGPRQRPEMAVSSFARLIREGGEVLLYGEGRLVRDYTCVGDVTQAIGQALERAGGSRVYNIGSGSPSSTRDLVSALEVALGRTARTRSIPAGPAELPAMYASIDRARRELGYAPATSLTAGIAEFVGWLEQQSASGSSA